jgi:hypothetical protein
MAERSGSRELTKLWSALLVSPFAWAACHGILLVMTDQACHGLPGSSLVVVGLAFAALAGSGALLARKARRSIRGAGATAGRGEFMATLAFWFAPLFALVVLVNTAAVFFLNPCPS